MLNELYIKISRNIQNTSYFTDAQLLRAWMGIILSVRFQPALTDGIYVDVNELLMTKDQLAALFGTDKRRAHTILQRMERDGLIKCLNVRNKYTHIKVLMEDFSFSSQRKEKEEKIKKETVSEKNIYPQKERVSEESTYPQKERVSEENIPSVNETVCERVYEPEPEKKVREDIFIRDTNNMSGIYSAWKSMSPAEINKAPPVERKEEGHYEEREIKAPEPTYERPFVREEERMDKNKNEREDEKNSSANEEEEKRPFGVFDNVLLTGTQYRSLLEKLPEAQLFIEKLSSYLASNPSKSYPNHYAVILSWYADYMLKNKNNGSNRTYKNKDSIPTPDPTASYDIRRAELRARTQVPTVKKRNRETGLWEEIKHT